jgi:hypothetical protein
LCRPVAVEAPRFSAGDFEAADKAFRPGPEGHDISIAHVPGLKAGASTLFKFTGIRKIP